MSRIWRLVTGLLSIGLIAYFIWVAACTIDFQTLRTVASPHVLFALSLAAVLYALIYPLTGAAWARLLKAQGEMHRSAWLASVIAVTQLAKYVPGNVLQIATRFTLALRGGIGRSALAVSIAQETVLAAAASVLVGLAMLTLAGHGAETLPPEARGVLPRIAVLAGLAVLVLAGIRLAPQRLLLSRFRLARWLGHLGGLPGARIAVPALLVYVLNYALVGVGLWLVAKAMGLSHSVDLPLVTAAFSLAWILGFLAPGAPAGLGVREGVMLVVLAGAASHEALLVFVLLARVATVGGDLIAFAAGAAWFLSQRDMAK